MSVGAIDNALIVGVTASMNAQLLLKERYVLSETDFVEMVVWSVPSPLPGSQHSYKYRLALVSKGTCVLRYDNEAGKGDHKHLEQTEQPYLFTNVDNLQSAFWDDVEAWRTTR